MRRVDVAHFCEYRGRHDKDPSAVIFANGTIAAASHPQLVIALMRERLTDG